MSAKKDKKKKRTALVICRSGKEFWTTQTEFWQWVRNRIVVKTQDNPLTGVFQHEDEENLVLLNHTMLNIAAPNHLREVMLSSRQVKHR
ncbi:MAG: hypothetical protein M3430_18340 [Acidobacteriota bacterium]|nr:hypothetical protein [Acidobacteriota bacterium]